MQETKP